jgi:hypothetical protein
MIVLGPFFSKPRHMQSEPPPSEAQRYREKALRIRGDAESFKDEHMRRQMLDIAAQYDRLADDLEGQADASAGGC